MFQNLLDLTREAIVKGILPDHAMTIVDINMARIAVRVGCQAGSSGRVAHAYPESVRPHLSALESFVGNVRLLSEGKTMEDNIDSWPRSYFRNINEAIPYIETSDLIDTI